MYYGNYWSRSGLYALDTHLPSRDSPDEAAALSLIDMRCIYRSALATGLFYSLTFVGYEIQPKDLGIFFGVSLAANIVDRVAHQEHILN